MRNPVHSTCVCSDSGMQWFMSRNSHWLEHIKWIMHSLRARVCVCVCVWVLYRNQNHSSGCRSDTEGFSQAVLGHAPLICSTFLVPFLHMWHWSWSLPWRPGSAQLERDLHTHTHTHTISCYQDRWLLIQMVQHQQHPTGSFRIAFPFISPEWVQF